MSTESKAIKTLARLRQYCENEQFKGWDPYDGLNSRVYRAIPLLNRSAIWRLCVIQGFKRSPINLRPLMLVPKEHNAKGIGLFLKGYPAPLGIKIAAMVATIAVLIFSCWHSIRYNLHMAKAHSVNELLSLN